MIQWPMILLASSSLVCHGHEAKIVHNMLMIFLWLGTPLCQGMPGTKLAKPAIGVSFLMLPITILPQWFYSPNIVCTACACAYALWPAQAYQLQWCMYLHYGAAPVEDNEKCKDSQANATFVFHPSFSTLSSCLCHCLANMFPGVPILGDHSIDWTGMDTFSILHSVAVYGIEDEKQLSWVDNFATWGRSQSGCVWLDGWTLVSWILRHDVAAYKKYLKLQ